MCSVSLSLSLLSRALQGMRFRNPAGICYNNHALERQKKEPEDVSDTLQGRAERGIIGSVSFWVKVHLRLTCALVGQALLNYLGPVSSSFSPVLCKDHDRYHLSRG